MPPVATEMEFKRLLPREWKWIALRGAIAVFFGLLIIAFPAFGAMSLVILFAAFVFADGVSALFVGWRMQKLDVPWWPYVLIGITGVLFGIFALLSWAFAATVFVTIVALWALLAGVFQIIAAMKLKGVADTEVLMFVSGLLAVVLGILLIFIPTPEGLLAIAIMAAMYALFYGILNLLLAFRLRGMNDID